MGIATATKAPEMVIDQEEGMLLSKATVNVMDQFDVTPDPKTQAIVGLIVAAATVYGPRAVMIRARRAQEEAEKAPNTAGVYTADGRPAGTTDFAAAPVMQ